MLSNSRIRSGLVDVEDRLLRQGLPCLLVGGCQGFRDLLMELADRPKMSLTTVAAGSKKRGGEVATHIKLALDLLAVDPQADPYPVLFPSPNPP